MPERERMLDLYSGAGSGAVGFEPYFDVTEAVEWNPDAAQSYQANHQDTRVRCMSVLDYWAGRRDFDGLHGVLATPPCQGSSIMNRKRSPDDPRDGLTGHTAELVAAVKPEWCVFENVPNVNKTQRARAEKAFERLGYRVRSVVLNSADYGAAQRRKRWILIATRPGRRLADLLPKPPETVREAFQRLPEGYQPSMNISPEVTASLAAVTQPGKWVKTSRRGFADTVRLAWDEPAPAITNVAKNYIIHPDHDRPIDIPEALVLFGLPGSYVLEGNKRSRAQQVANMVPAPLAAAIAKSLVQDGPLNPPIWSPAA